MQRSKQGLALYMPSCLYSLAEWGRRGNCRTVGQWNCDYFDDVQSLAGFGAANKESLAELVWAFFEYWAWRHDYNNSVVSVRTGGFLTKSHKEWTRRVGNERHLVCIEVRPLASRSVMCCKPQQASATPVFTTFTNITKGGEHGSGMPSLTYTGSPVLEQAAHGPQGICHYKAASISCNTPVGSKVSCSDIKFPVCATQDPFEVSHDLGRTVDRQTSGVLHKEFERAACILRDLPQPLDKLMDPYRAGKSD